MKTGRKLGKAALAAAAIAILAAGSSLSAWATTTDHFFEIIANVDPDAAANLTAAMYKLDDETSDVEGNVQELRDLFMNDPRSFLQLEGVDLSPADYGVTAFDFAALKELPNAFSDSPLAPGLRSLPYAIGWRSDNTVILLQFAAPASEADDGAVRYATVPPDSLPTQEWLRMIVGTADENLEGLLGLLVELSTDAAQRAECVRIGIRQFAANHGFRFESDHYAMQIIDLDPIEGPKPEIGVHYAVSPGEGVTAPEAFGFLYIYDEGASYGVLLTTTF